MAVQWLRAWRQVRGRSRQTALRRCLAAFLLLAFAASAAFNVAVASQASLAASTAAFGALGAVPSLLTPHRAAHASPAIVVRAGTLTLERHVAAGSMTTTVEYQA